MGFINLVRKALIILMLLSFSSCSRDKNAEKDIKPPIVVPEEELGIYGWDSLTLRNTFVRFDVVPDLGGKIMGFYLQGYQVLWHDSTREGVIDTNQGYGFGEKYFNPGGAKVWPAPQGWSGKDMWPGPPDNVLDSSTYEYTTDGNSITVISPKDDGVDRTGLQFKHTYSIKKTSTVADLHLSMSNVVDRTVKWSLWHLATLPTDREFTVYVPVDKGNWHVIFGDKENPQWLGVQDRLFRARYDKRVGKVGMKVREGWAAWHDETNDIVYAMMFPVKKGAEYPDNGSNFEIYTSGAGTIQINNQDITSEYSPETATIELEVMGPLTELAPGSSASIDVTWGMCRCSGVKKVVPMGVMSEEFDHKDCFITGKFGVFYGGTLQELYLQEDGKQRGYKNITRISPLEEVILHRTTEYISESITHIRFQLVASDNTVIGVIGNVKVK